WSVWGRVVIASIEAARKGSGRGVSLKPMIAQAHTIGDEAHNMYNATTPLLIPQVVPFMLKSGFDRKMLFEAAKCMNENNFTALNLGMAAANAMSLAAHDVPHSTLLTVMSRSGTDAGS